MTAAAYQPVYAPPAGACDSHCHIWGPTDRFPFAAGRPYTPPDRDKHVLTALHRRLGLQRTVIVQPIVYGSDNAAMLDAIADDPRNRRGIALLGPDDTDAQLLRLHEAGIRGVRFGFVKHLKRRPDLAFLRRTAERIAPLGWHVQLHLDADQLDELGDAIRSLRLPVVIDHMGRVDAALGLEQPAFQLLLDLVRRDERWIKLSGANRVSAIGAPFEDVVPFARALIDAAPDRVLWGTDFPHPLSRHPVEDEALLLDLLPQFGDAAALQRLMVDNPTRLYGF
ncbi:MULTISPECIES: amidohydrolase family protein [Ramlibacter]|uniref:Amidohydrolase family protein n=1 Tax=Ramlibacter pinisoli TaxID=2682844 RepID=A0A6N8IZ62_9BURK|nr:MULTISPECIES: amidohydrolase family protein [Ramlibacter]MBA2962387.1 amidohydrolase family protein [Ramlibacter sp. CGMCC 1.13660]MVQ32329.1 amidohydrolase family protein [Ramlibacter pinisoli]